MTDVSDIDQEEALVHLKLAKLRLDHEDLDHAIKALITVGSDPLRLQRFKKKKLNLKDEISKMESLIIPDITA